MISTIAPRSTNQATLISGILGSGKTWYLTNQLLQAARTHQSPPDCTAPYVEGGSLLALAGQAGCAALRERVDVDRPLGCTKCDVLTFPALVRTIVHDFGPTVGEYTPADVRFLDHSNLAVFLHRNLDTLPLGRYRPLHTPGDAVRPLLHLFSSLAHCGVTPRDYLRYVETLEAELLAEKEQTAVGPSPDDANGQGNGAAATVVAATRAQLRARLEGEAWRNHVAGERDKANSYEAFLTLKRREEVVDYADHLLLARRVLQGSTDARAALALRLSHIFVDDLHEYSPAMMDILAEIVAPGVGITAAADPMLAATSRGCAGRNALGANHTAVALFKKAFPESAELRLDGNRHSADAIQVAMRALEPRDTPVAKKKKSTKKATKGEVAGSAASTAESSVPSQTEKAAGSTAAARRKGLTCLTFETEGDELRALGKRVRDLRDEGVSPRDIGIAAIGGWGVTNTLIAALSAAGVPVEGGRQFSTVFESETARILMSFLRCLVHPSESTPLLHLLLSCPAYALPGGELTTALEGHLSRYIPLRDFLQNSFLADGSTEPHGDGISTSAKEVAGRLLSDLTRFAEMGKKRGAREVMLEFLRHTGQLQRLEEPTTREEEREGRAVAELFEVAAMAEKQAGGDAAAVVEPVLRLFRRHGVGHTDSSRFDQEQTETPPVDEAGSWGGAVRVFQPGKDDDSTIGSFHTVFIPFCSRARLPGPLRAARLPVPGPFRGAPQPRDAVSVRSEADLTRTYHENRARALLYAAVGSAREDVCLSVSAHVSRGRTQLTPSPFLAEILGADAPREWKSAPAAVLNPRVGISAVDGEGAASDVAGNERLLALVPKTGDGDVGRSRPLRLSFSAINAYGSCPHSYYLQYVLNVSPPPNPRMVYGRAMHEAVAAFLRAAIAGGAGGVAPPTLQAAVEAFKLHFDGCAFESAEQVRTLRANGVAGLESFLSRLLEGRIGLARMVGEGSWKNTSTGCSDFENDLRPRLLVERKFMVKVAEAGVVMSGIFDRVDIIPAGAGEAPRSPLVFITDYKSNVGAKDPARIVQDNLQLRLYSLAAERLFGVKPAELAIEAIEDGRRGVAVPSPADLEVALEAISETASAVRAGNFDATPSYQSCNFCGFKHMCRHSSVTSAAL